ncbi:metallophosphoesterase [Hoeflea sp. WL0058]|uniref:Metallophosphoesterase n=1 Tax=Flavimaribacter sediminis TaxID=2865987 RepID=A0AAE2ZN59_9HYPH|nr:metallophosphoesterase [Flavimaribacter sediminis]MBW8637755.1 metallophosphoesterase [Flavimaribacter sediminis]
MPDDSDRTPLGALLPKGGGHQFVLYGDSCSGVPGGPHEQTLARVNRVVSRLAPKPDFIIYPGDEVMGLTNDEAELRRQWAYFLGTEMAWLDPDIPVYHATGNHTTYSIMSERVFADVLSHLPRNGAAGQEGLSYFIRRDDLLIVFVHTLSQAMGGEGHVETDWLDATLAANDDARWKLVVGHHPAFPANGYEGPYQRTIGDDYVDAFRNTLKRHDVFAYLCSHLLLFDAQAHDGVLQILTAGAGTAERMPKGIEYLHCVQAALDEDGLRYQVIDDEGAVRERLAWPLRHPPSDEWMILSKGEMAAPLQGYQDAAAKTPAILSFRFRGRAAEIGGPKQTLLAALDATTGTEPVWIGLTGACQKLTVILQPYPNNSPHYWFGPELDPGRPFDLQLALHGGMGPGGLIWRRSDDDAWSSLEHRSPWGLEKIHWPATWHIGHGPDPDDRPFAGSDLLIRHHFQGI